MLRNYDIQKCHSLIANCEQDIISIKALIAVLENELNKIDKILSEESFVNKTIQMNKERMEKIKKNIIALKQKIIKVLFMT